MTRTNPQSTRPNGSRSVPDSDSNSDPNSASDSGDADARDPGDAVDGGPFRVAADSPSRWRRTERTAVPDGGTPADAADVDADADGAGADTDADPERRAADADADGTGADIDADGTGPDADADGLPERLARVGPAFVPPVLLAARGLRTVVRALLVGVAIVVLALADADRRRGLRRWLLLEGDRWTVAGGFVASVFVGAMLLASTDVVGLAKAGFVVTLFGGVISGLFSFVPIVISVNQLAVSRLSGTPRDLREDVEEVRTFREKVERMHAHAHPETDPLVSPTDPDAFLDRVVAVVGARATDLEAAAGDAPGVAAYVAVVRRQIAHVHEQIEAGDGRLIELLAALMGDNYSRNVVEARRLRRDGTTLDDEARGALHDLEELFASMDVLRQYYKSMYIQTELSRLSRLIVYVGVVAFLLSAFLIVLFAGGVPAGASPLALDLLVSVSLAVASLPFAVLASYVIRIAAIAERTAAPGAFTPPSERPEYSQHRG